MYIYIYNNNFAQNFYRKLDRDTALETVPVLGAMRQLHTTAH